MGHLHTFLEQPLRDSCTFIEVTVILNQPFHVLKTDLYRIGLVSLLSVVFLVTVSKAIRVLVYDRLLTRWISASQNSYNSNGRRTSGSFNDFASRWLSSDETRLSHQCVVLTK